MGGRRTVGGLAIAGLVVWLFAGSKKYEELDALPAPREVVEPPAVPLPAEMPVRAQRSWQKRAATTLAFTALFFAGAALTAGAGNELAHVDAGSTDSAVADVATTDETTSTDEVTTTGAETTTDAATTTTDEVTTTETTTTDEVPTTEATPAPTGEAVVATVPDPSNAAPVAASAPVVATPAPAVEAAAAAPVAVQHTHAAAHVAVVPARAPMTPGASPFPVIAFDPQLWLVDHPGTPVGDAVVAIAERYLGVPYRWGGNQPSTGFDCSGLTQFVYAQLGVWLPHYAAAQFLAYQRLDASQLQPGDLVFFEPKADGPGHVAIYAGNDHIVEAPHTGALVRIGSLSGAAASLGFLGAVRPSDGAISVAPVRRVASAHHAVAADPGVALALMR